MILVPAILFGLYAFCMLVLVLGFKKHPIFSTEAYPPLNGFTIIIPFRNEAENLPALLKSISHLNYPLDLFEVLLVNDDSDDLSEKIIGDAIVKSEISIQILQNKRLSNSPKKDAISKAIKRSKFDWIITSDADCELSENWLKTLDAFIQNQLQNGKKYNPMMVCGPVFYKSDGSFLQNFQQMDGFSLQSVTIGSFGLKRPILSNGANLAYRKDAFETVNGFVGNNHIASGDDIFLMEKMKKMYPTGVQFLKSEDVIVSTKPQLNWRKLISQRIRWASKTSKQKNGISLLLGIMVFLVNLSFLILPFAIIFDFQNVIFYVFLILLKISIDYIVVRQSAMLFGEAISFWKFIGLSFTYAALILIVVFGSLGGKYSWKGRAFQNQR